MQTILITGANSGIGEALVLLYARQKQHLILVARNEQRLSEVAEQCKELGATLVTASIDVRDKQKLAEFIVAQDEKNPIDIVVANAGIATAQAKKQVSASEEINQLIFDVNVQGVLNTIHPILPRMRARKSGQLVLMSSLASYISGTNFSAYCASKVAVRNYALSLRGLLKQEGVKVNAICPGFIKTPLTDENDFPMFNVMKVDKAAKIIAKGIHKNKALIAFPLSTYLATRLYWLLPVCLQMLCNGRV